MPRHGNGLLAAAKFNQGFENHKTAGSVELFFSFNPPAIRTGKAKRVCRLPIPKFMETWLSPTMRSSEWNFQPHAYVAVFWLNQSRNIPGITGH